MRFWLGPCIPICGVVSSAVCSSAVPKFHLRSVSQYRTLQQELQVPTSDPWHEFSKGTSQSGACPNDAKQPQPTYTAGKNSLQAKQEFLNLSQVWRIYYIYVCAGHTTPWQWVTLWVLMLFKEKYRSRGKSENKEKGNFGQGFQNRKQKRSRWIFGLQYISSSVSFRLSRLVECAQVETRSFIKQSVRKLTYILNTVRQHSFAKKAFCKAGHCRGGSIFLLLSTDGFLKELYIEGAGAPLAFLFCLEAGSSDVLGRT